MNFKIENNNIKVVISNKGAEVQSFFNKTNSTEYIWQGDAKYWGRKAPLLFPIVGQVQHGEYQFEGKSYKLPQHGFLRDKELALLHQDNHSLILSFKSDEETKLVYPFDFEFKVSYWIEDYTLHTTYSITNLNSEKPMYFSFGLHPGFNVPLEENTVFEDYYIEFEKNETADCLLLDGPFLSGESKHEFLNNSNKIALQHSLFDNDALIFENLQSNFVSIKSEKTSKSIQMMLSGYPLLGIWSKPQSDAPYVCIEPWLGVADEKNSGKSYNQKKGIQYLSPCEEIKIESYIKIS